MSLKEPVLKYNSICIDYLDSQVIKDVSFELYKGEILGIVGESGSGKSTIIKAAMGILNSDGEVKSGEILFEGNNLLTLSEKKLSKIRGWEIGMIFQDATGSLCPIRTIGDQVLEALRARKVDKQKLKGEAIKLFDKLNFKDSQKVWDSYPFELSGGMNQRVAVAITMLMNPKVLLADEPTSALDNISRNQVIEELIELKNMGTSIIIVTHDIDIVRAICDRVLVLKNGIIQEYGKVASVMTFPESDYTKLLIDSTAELRRGGLKATK